VLNLSPSVAALSALLAVAPVIRAQQRDALNPPQPPAAAASPVESLKIFVLEGRGAIHSIRDRGDSMPVVEVRDDNGLPVEGAEVKFDLPPAGPGGSFPGQQFTATAKTNIQGQAAVSFVPNLEAGRFNIRVTATLGNRIGHVMITQTNSARTSSAEPRSGPFVFAWWKGAVVAGGGATLGIILAKRGG